MMLVFTGSTVKLGEVLSGQDSVRLTMVTQQSLNPKPGRSHNPTMPETVKYSRMHTFEHPLSLMAVKKIEDKRKEDELMTKRHTVKDETLNIFILNNIRVKNFLIEHHSKAFK